MKGRTTKIKVEPAVFAKDVFQSICHFLSLFDIIRLGRTCTHCLRYIQDDSNFCWEYQIGYLKKYVSTFHMLIKKTPNMYVLIHNLIQFKCLNIMFYVNACIPYANHVSLVLKSDQTYILKNWVEVLNVTLRDVNPTHRQERCVIVSYDGWCCDFLKDDYMYGMWKFLNSPVYKLDEFRKKGSSLDLLLPDNTTTKRDSYPRVIYE